MRLRLHLLSQRHVQLVRKPSQLWPLQVPILHQWSNPKPPAAGSLAGSKVCLAARQRLPRQKKHPQTLDAAAHESAASAVAVMNVAAATNAVDAAVVTIAMEAIVPNAQIAHRAKMANHPSRVSQEVIALLVNQELTAHHAKHVQRDKNNASHAHRVNQELSEHHVRRALIVQTCANHVKAMHQRQQKLRKL